LARDLEPVTALTPSDPFRRIEPRFTLCRSLRPGWGFREAQRENGNNNCNGLTNSGGSSGNCAFRDIWKAEAICSSAGDIIKINADANGSYYKEKVALDHTGNCPSLPIKVEGYGDTDLQPHIGNVDVFTSGWTYDQTNDTYNMSYTPDDPNERIWAAYIDFEGTKEYEHGRMGLVIYEDLADITANPSTYSGASTNYYIGPGVYFNKSTDTLQVRLKPTPKMDAYQSKYLQLGIGQDAGESINPNNFKIIVGSSEYSIRVNGSCFELSHLTIEPAKTSLHLCADEQDQNAFTIKESTIWAGNDGAIRSTCIFDDVTIERNSILGDIPYWVSWGDCKHSNGPCENSEFGWRNTLIRPGNGAGGTDWVIDHNLIRGFHDAIGTEGYEEDLRVSYNVIADIADDPFEIEGLHIGEVEVYGNLITNSLLCFAAGQNVSGSGTTSIDGPLWFYSNLCVLGRIPFMERGGDGCSSDCQIGTFNGSREYGNQYAFKFDDNQTHSHIYNNTVFLVDSAPNEGMGFLKASVTVGTKVLNNAFIKLNNRVGQSSYPSDVNQVDYNLYWKMNNDSAALADSYDTVGSSSVLCTTESKECHGKGAIQYVGTDAQVSDEYVTAGYREGFGCLNTSACEGVDKSVSTRWKVKAGSEFWEPQMFVPEAGSPLCNAGIGASDPNLFPAGFPTMHVVDPNASLSKVDIGAVPCNIEVGQIAKWSEFPFNKVWKTDDLASGSAPEVQIYGPGDCPEEAAYVGVPEYFCGSKTDSDGAPPYTYLWDFSGTGCPSDQTTLCPGNLTFTAAGTCNVTLTITDRWGLSDTDECEITVTTGGGGGGCSDCSRCICQEN